ncbi:cupin domain-containing protein [Reinekea sp. G2M2-21]|uniref:cupin domain-containing protein n=1 Tax=Reinekea sp. G2M2-21 TaxID=2788942 RepID=UPI0018A9CD66|nr:cupin domain-containing protein [Reinekea sp. G2M2-21]
MFVHNSEVKLEDLGDGVSRKIMAYSDKIMAVEVYFEKGAVGPLHSHPHEQLTYVLSGEFEFTIGDETQVVKAGDVLYKKPNVVHGCVCKEKGVLLDNFTPMREDFLEAGNPYAKTK